MLIYVLCFALPPDSAMNIRWLEELRVYGCITANDGCEHI